MELYYCGLSQRKNYKLNKGRIYESAITVVGKDVCGILSIYRTARKEKSILADVTQKGITGFIYNDYDCGSSKVTGKISVKSADDLESAGNEQNLKVCHDMKISSIACIQYR